MLAILIIFLTYANINMAYLNILYTQFKSLEYIKPINETSIKEADIIRCFKNSYDIETKQFNYQNFLIDFYINSNYYWFMIDGVEYYIYYSEDNLKYYEIKK